MRNKPVIFPFGWPRESRAAAVLCLHFCPQLAQCRVYARFHPELPGIVAGLTQAERAAGLTEPWTPPERLARTRPPVLVYGQ